MTFLEEIVQELLNDRPKTDEAKICEALHIPRYLREYDFCDFIKETNERLIRAGIIGHYKITDNQKVEIYVNDVGCCIRIICRTIRRGENGETEEVNTELRVSFLEFEQAIDIDARMEGNIRRVIYACDRVVHERSIRNAEFANSPRQVDLKMKIEVERNS